MKIHKLIYSHRKKKWEKGERRDGVQYQMWRRQNCVEMLSSKDRVRNPIMKWIFHFFLTSTPYFLSKCELIPSFQHIQKFSFWNSHFTLRWGGGENYLISSRPLSLSLEGAPCIHTLIHSDIIIELWFISPCHSYRNLISTFSFCHSREWSSLPPTTRPPSPLSHSFGYLHSHSIDARADRTQFFFLEDVHQSCRANCLSVLVFCVRIYDRLNSLSLSICEIGKYVRKDLRHLLCMAVGRRLLSCKIEDWDSFL